MKKTDIDLDALFGRFYGRRIELTENITTDMMGFQNRSLDADPARNPLLAEMEGVAAENGLRFRLWTPTTLGTKEFYTNRVNITLQQAPDKTGWIVDRAANDSGQPKMSLLPHEFGAKVKPQEQSPVIPPAAESLPTVEAQQSIRIMHQLKLRLGRPK